MPKVTATATVNPNAIKAAVEKAADPAVRAGVMRAGEEMVKIANNLMAGDFNLNRPFERRRYPGSRRAATALDFAVSGTNGNYQLEFRVLGGEDVVKRIIFMNYGTSPHMIYPSGAWSLKGQQVYSRLTRGSNVTRSGFNQPLLAWVDEDSGESVVTTEVDHPGQAGTGFLEEARDAIVARAGAFF